MRYIHTKYLDFKIDHLFFHDDFLYYLGKGVVIRNSKIEPKVAKFTKSKVSEFYIYKQALLFNTKIGTVYYINLKTMKIVKLVDNVKHLQLCKDTLFYLKDDILYRFELYNKTTKVVCLLKYKNEFIVINKILYFIVQKTFKNIVSDSELNNMPMFYNEKLLSVVQKSSSIFVETENSIIFIKDSRIENLFVKDSNYKFYAVVDYYLIIIDLYTRIYDVFTGEEIGCIKFRCDHIGYDKKHKTFCVLVGNHIFKYRFEDDKKLYKLLDNKEYSYCMGINKKETLYRMFVDNFNSDKRRKGIYCLVDSGEKVEFNRKFLTQDVSCVSAKIRNEYYLLTKEEGICYIYLRAIKKFKEVNTVAFVLIAERMYSELIKLLQILSINNYNKRIKVFDKLNRSENHTSNMKTALQLYNFNFRKSLYIIEVYNQGNIIRSRDLLMFYLSKNVLYLQDLESLLQLYSPKLIDFLFRENPRKCSSKVIKSNNISNICYLMKKHGTSAIEVNDILSYFEKNDLKSGFTVYDLFLSKSKIPFGKLEVFNNVADFIFFRKYKTDMSTDNFFLDYKR